MSMVKRMERNWNEAQQEFQNIRQSFLMVKKGHSAFSTDNLKDLLDKFPLGMTNSGSILGQQDG